MVGAWIQDVQTRDDRFADLCIQNLHRWIVDEKNPYYDPYLAKMLTKLMKIAFSRLLKEFKDHNQSIVFANLSKIIIDTKKYSEEEARRSTKYVLE